MQEVIKCISSRFGWDKGDYWIIHNARACAPYDHTEGFSLVVFAAYAKAEMANRGHAMLHRLSGVYLYTYGPGSGEVTMTIRSHHSCDHNDPISVAEAELRCIADALQSNSVIGSSQLTLTPPPPHNQQVDCPNDTTPSQHDIQ